VIIFETIRWKNLLSTGDVWTEMPLNDRDSVLIIGDNGSGKSTILDALTFVLFGKSFRKINKPQLVNSVNEKGLLVQVTFKIGKRQYNVIRGIKPNIFEIHADGVMLNQDSASRDYQEYLENHILKMNYKSFTQVVILGSASFTPFMQLSPTDRRVIIEDLLDIQVFSVMNMIVKQKYQANKESLEKVRMTYKMKVDQKVILEKTIRGLKSDSNDRSEKLKTKKDDIETETRKLEKAIIDAQVIMDEKIDGMIDETVMRDKHNKLIGLQSKIDQNLRRSMNEIDFYAKNDNCPTCHQLITEAFKKDKIPSLRDKVKDYESGMAKIGKDMKVCVHELSSIQLLAKEIDTVRNTITSMRAKLNHNISVSNDIEDAIEDLSNSDDILLDNEKELAVVTDNLETADQDRTKYIDERAYIETAISLLKDGGIKTKIIKQYLPVMNKLINKYLAALGFLVNFEIDENFQEIIKSRHRDIFSYASFSEGEKMRIDIALLFTWRAVAKMKNSVGTNLLILDEIFDSSLDAEGTTEFIKIMKSMIGETNMFVISHKQEMINDFDKIYHFEKVKNFSRIK
jgi:DNA repair exonuclease SbcCD ATPase subunit